MFLEQGEPDPKTATVRQGSVTGARMALCKVLDGTLPSRGARKTDGSAGKVIAAGENKGAQTNGIYVWWLLLVVVWAFGGSGLCMASPPARGQKRDRLRYAIVTTRKTAEQAGWKDVVEALRKKRSGKIFYRGDGGEGALREELRAFRPYYVCFVARPDELARQGKVKARTRSGRLLETPLCGVYYRGLCDLIRSLDDDPYDDAIWAVLTGATPQDALRVVSAKPLTVRRGLSHVTSGWLNWMESGVSFNECKKGQKWLKQPGKPPEECQGPQDTTKQFVAELNLGNVDMVSTSGHATEHDWQMGYSYRGGQVITPAHLKKLPQAARDNYRKLLDGKKHLKGRSAARLLAVDTSQQVYEILTSNPKVYYSPGNCRIARVDGSQCMVLGWIHHGAMQFFGHVGLQTRSCYAWGVAEYFLALQGRFSFAEAVWLNQQALRWELGRMSKQDKARKYICCRNERCFHAGGSFFWETTVLYGDPAWEARVKSATAPLYDQHVRTRRLGDGRTEVTFTVTMRRQSVPSRPAAFFMDVASGSHVEVKEGPKDLLVADGFALVPFWKAGGPAPKTGRQFKATVILGRVPAGKKLTPNTGDRE